ncbi:cell envelope integrity protein CreD [Halioxenophilus sp. WMMB6]|uniref:cell envelope integrity protein CreD n=1 Tax=Halioxenophilus sp. WMMB6 TaxID=3073815 RepID=UPI00295EB6D3|nr:cell envelope integrity protein CreD [Halioxenophilus sp. WMMB6]
MQKQLAIKILMIFALALLVLIPISMVSHKVSERYSYQLAAKASVAESWTGSQRLMTPVLVIPYQVAVPSRSADGVQTENLVDSRLVIPAQAAEINTVVDSQYLMKGIYKIPVYNSKILLQGHFAAADIQSKLRSIEQEERFHSVGTPYLSLHVGDVRGIDTAPKVSINGEPRPAQPGSGMSGLATGVSVYLSNLKNSEQPLHFAFELSLRGTEELTFIPVGDEVKVTMQSTWPHPEFIGAQLPGTRAVSDDGFSAAWSTTQYSSNNSNLINRCFTERQCEPILTSGFGARLIEPVDVYLQSERTVKYAMLFIGLSFITFFIFEQLKRIRIHPIQYAFVGLAISLFYLLLISLAEHIAFGLAYALGAVSCCGLLLFYVRHMLHSFLSALLFATMLLGLYGLLYVIVQAEDYALLMGSILVFVILAVVMMVTRKIDWYDLAEASRSNSANLELNFAAD